LTPEAAAFFEKANRLLGHADTMVGVGLNDEVGRTAYLAAFHAAQALIFEVTGKIAKTHKGVQTEFLRITKDNPRVDYDLRIFLSQAYNLKSIADYEIGPNSEIDKERAENALSNSKLFISHLRELVDCITST